MSIKQIILNEFHRNPYISHPGYQKNVLCNKKGLFLAWYEKGQIKSKHQYPVGLLHPFPIPKWKWDTITMDFITGLPKTMKRNDSVMAVIDKLSKVAHFIPVKPTSQTSQVAYVFMREIFILLGMPKANISYQDVKFTFAFCKALFTWLGTKTQYSYAYHPQTDGKNEQENQVVDDILLMYVMQQPGKWKIYLYLVEFAYNNNYHESLKLSPYEILYGKSFWVPSNWNSPENKLILGPDMLEEMENIVGRVEQSLKAAQDQQKSYADKKEPNGNFRWVIVFTCELNPK